MTAKAPPGSRPGAALVTGASREIGIGAAVVRKLTAAGWDVFTTWWAPYDESMAWGSRPDETAELLASTGAQGVQADLAEPDAPAAVFEAAVRGVGPIRALVNVHTYDPGGGIFDIDGAELDRHLAANVRSTYLLCREFAERFDAADGPGRIVNFVSGPPLTGSVAYAMSKGAVHWMTMSIAGELASADITVNALNPGPTDTGWMEPELKERLDAASPMGRVSEPVDAANLVNFLLSDDGGWMTGQLLHSDGGFAQLAHP